MPGRIFINYRRGTGAASAGRLADRLTQHFDRDQIFIDVDAIEPGIDFVKALNDQVAQSIAFIAVIDPDWLSTSNAAGKRRLDDPRDYVRIEIEAALKRDIRVVPVLVDGAQMPTSGDLPDSLKLLTHRQAFEISHIRFNRDADDLAFALQRGLGLHSRPQPASRFVADKESARPEVTWTDFLFSFSGRVSRKQFCVAFLALCFVYWALVLAMGVTLFIAFIAIGDRDKFQAVWDESIGVWISGITILPFLWPMAALYLKRLHDFGQGWALFWITTIVSFAPYSVKWLGGEQVAVSVMIAASFVITILVACIKGAPGPNEFGPDPLEREARR
jgi:uncharacterized membrane protein YhaH (DUF805 family)